MEHETLRITGNVEDAFDLLDVPGHDGLSGHFDDNGGDPDGNAWLPSQPLSEIFLVGRVLQAHLGHLVQAQYFDSATDAANWLNIASDLRNCQEIEDNDAWRNVVRDKCAEKNIAWAHYGAWLCGDEIYVFEMPTA
jgi:hypothetical protein